MLVAHTSHSVGFPGESPASNIQARTSFSAEGNAMQGQATDSYYPVKTEPVEVYHQGYPDQDTLRPSQEAFGPAGYALAAERCSNIMQMRTQHPSIRESSGPRELSKKRSSSTLDNPLNKLYRAAASFQSKPSIVCRPKPVHMPNEADSRCSSQSNEEFEEMAVTVPCWPADPMSRRMAERSARASSQDSGGRKSGEPGLRQSVHKVARQKGVSSGRKYTSKYRGVHQTFPTRRWEAQFRRAGKPTSLGCFDREEEAARAYDKMMVWVELHSVEMRNCQGPPVLKGGTTNFEVNEYLEDIPELQIISQEELVQALRREGRSQAAANTAAALKARPRISVCAKG